MDVDALAKEYLNEAEEFFGPMISEWDFSGVEFGDSPPHLVYYPEACFVGISLSNRAKEDDLQLHFQLAHEVCHMLYPCMNIDTLQFEKPTVLNEGVSTYFSIIATSKFGVMQEAVANLRQHNIRYFEAFSLVLELMSVDKQAIKKLRVVEPRLNRILPIHFSLAKIDVSDDLMQELLRDFS
jgi:hypothetical protein